MPVMHGVHVKRATLRLSPTSMLYAQISEDPISDADSWCRSPKQHGRLATCAPHRPEASALLVHRCFTAPTPAAARVLHKPATLTGSHTTAPAAVQVADLASVLVSGYTLSSTDSNTRSARMTPPRRGKSSSSYGRCRTSER